MVKLKKKKYRLKRLLFTFISLLILIVITISILMIDIKNIYIYNSQILKDQTIIELGNIDNYPSCYLTFLNKVKKRLLENPYIKEANVERKWFCEFHITVTEHKPLFIKRSNSKVVIDNNMELVNDYDFNNIPLLINFVPEKQYKKLIENMKLINFDVISKISEIEYKPNDVDKERFLLSMNDSNYIYLTLSTFNKLNYYLTVLPKLEGKKGIFYWDAGDFFKIIE